MFFKLFHRTPNTRPPSRKFRKTPKAPESPLLVQVEHSTIVETDSGVLGHEDARKRIVSDDHGSPEKGKPWCAPWADAPSPTPSSVATLIGTPPLGKDVASEDTESPPITHLPPPTAPSLPCAKAADVVSECLTSAFKMDVFDDEDYDEDYDEDDEEEDLSAYAAAAASPSPPPPRKLTTKDFRIIRTLGFGAYGYVLKVQDRITGKIYALKMVSKASTSITDDTKVMEEQAIMRMVEGDPRFIQLRASFEDEDRFYYLMDVMPRGDLKEKMAMSEKMSEDEARRIFGSLALGMKRLHEMGVVHRDFKPDNVLFDAHDQPVIADFGIASRVGPDSTVSGSCGTAMYAPPEQLAGAPCSAKVDVWAWAMSLGEAVDGRPLFGTGECEYADEVRDCVEKGSVLIDGDASDEFFDLLCMCLVKDPTRRPGWEEIMQHPWFDGFDWDEPRKDPPAAVLDERDSEPTLDIAQIKFAEAYPDGEEPHPEFTWVSPELDIPAPSPVAATLPSGGINRTTSTVSIASPASWTTLHAGGWPLPALRDNFSLCPGVLSIPKPTVPVVNDTPRYDAHTPQSCVVEYMDDPTLFEFPSPSTTAAIHSVWMNMDKISARPVPCHPVRRLTLTTSAPWRCLDSDEPHLGTLPVRSRLHVPAPALDPVVDTSSSASPIPDAPSHSAPVSSRSTDPSQSVIVPTSPASSLSTSSTSSLPPPSALLSPVVWDPIATFSPDIPSTISSNSYSSLMQESLLSSPLQSSPPYGPVPLRPFPSGYARSQPCFVDLVDSFPPSIASAPLPRSSVPAVWTHADEVPRHSLLRSSARLLISTHQRPTDSSPLCASSQRTQPCLPKAARSSISDSANISPSSAVSSCLRVAQSASSSDGPIVVKTMDSSTLSSALLDSTLAIPNPWALADDISSSDTSLAHSTNSVWLPSSSAHLVSVDLSVGLSKGGFTLCSRLRPSPSHHAVIVDIPACDSAMLSQSCTVQFCGGPEPLPTSTAKIPSVWTDVDVVCSARRPPLRSSGRLATSPRLSASSLRSGQHPLAPVPTGVYDSSSTSPIPDSLSGWDDVLSVAADIGITLDVDDVDSVLFNPADASSIFVYPDDQDLPSRLSTASSTSCTSPTSIIDSMFSHTSGAMEPPSASGTGTFTDKDVADRASPGGGRTPPAGMPWTKRLRGWWLRLRGGSARP